MKNRTRKPAVPPHIRRAWYRRYDEEGESAPDIARADGYDVRTVRKMLEMERQEREIKSARSSVLRNAVEQHYQDLCTFAQRLDSQLKGEDPIPSEMRGDRMWEALKEHLPRSPIWKNLNRRDSLVQDLNTLEDEVEVMVREQLIGRLSVGFVGEDQDVGLSPTAVDPIAFNLKNSAEGAPFLLSRDDFKLTSAGKGSQQIEVGAFGIGVIPAKKVSEVQSVIAQLLEEVSGWDQRNSMDRLLSELDRTRTVLQDELAIVILRRIVPGKCKYCPL